MWTVLSYFVVVLYLAVVVLGPVATLLVVRRRGGSWRRAIYLCMGSATVGAALVCGTLVWVHTTLREWIYGPSGSTAFMTAFPGGTIYGALIATTFLPVALIPVGLWRLIHRSSFDWMTSPPMKAVPALEETTW
jgi:hypothetical protein